MLFFLVSCLFFFLLSQSFLKPHSPSKIGTRMWAFWESLHKYFLLLSRKRKIFIRAFHVPSIKKLLSPRLEIVEEKEEISLLDLPDLALDCILEKLLPKDLCTIAKVCSSLREKCTSDHIWEKHFKQKWGGVIGDAAFREWKYQHATKRALKFLSVTSRKNKYYSFSSPLEFLGYKTEIREWRSVNSVMSFYVALETGIFWFPAQVFNRENGSLGFMLSCYDALLSYDSTTDNFVARYPAQGRSLIEENIEWNRIRAPSVDTLANVLHISDCLDDLKPDDHIEVQWRKNKNFPYGMSLISFFLIFKAFS
ncbi:hypothetical protein CDL12_29791 [Handroanthus impetiginosus]|uniref:F-box domain-containing protein n=1 Tax=Handroanthus impetiginosus TaxID=429701 RepID=A0A2G9FXE3_9LAMI|nr:hypothetical protein CDL12_29791 [Handroanthus impetiginosus]